MSQQVFQPVLAAPLKSMVHYKRRRKRYAAQAYLSIYNRNLKDPDDSRFGSLADRAVLGLPTSLVPLFTGMLHYFGFKFGNWDFATPTHARTAIEVGAGLW